MTHHPVHRRKKLIEVAIPLEAINAASAREKSIRHGHPSTLHLWWARRPLAAARAVIFCQMVDDPSAVPEEFPTEDDQEKERLRLFALISELVQWENTTNETVLERAREEIRRSWRRCCIDNADHPEAAELFNPEKLPGFHDPFAGGGALPLEAQRLGLEATASDLNPVAVLINKAMIEIPPKFAGMPPVNPEARSKKQLIAKEWKGAEGLAEDVRYYGRWMRDEAQRRIGHLYPKVKITPDIVAERSDLQPYEGQELTVIAWIWARTVRSPNPAFSHVEVPLASTFALSTKTRKESWVEPVIEEGKYRLKVLHGVPNNPEKVRLGTSAGKRAAFKCIMTGDSMDYKYIRNEGKSGRLGTRLMAIVAEGNRERVYLSPIDSHEQVARLASPEWKPDLLLANNQRNFNTPNYGLASYGDLFTSRQLVALTCFSSLISEVRSMIAAEPDCIKTNDSSVLVDGQISYPDAIAIFLSFVVSKTADGSSSICRWMPQRDSLYNTFSKQALPMTWDFPEVNVLANCTRSLTESIKWTAEAIEGLGAARALGHAVQDDASRTLLSENKVVSTDPPYYDNICYADLSDFFYVWLRRSLQPILPGLFATLAVPKSDELIAASYRHGGVESAEVFFLNGMMKAIGRLARYSHEAYPVTIYYAFKQAEVHSPSGTASTGWETFLEAVLRGGFSLVGTWPIRTERAGRSIGIGSNALASSVVLVCQRRLNSPNALSRADFRRQLRQVLPRALRKLERSNIAPVDVAQAAIGPGMAIFSQARAVLNPDDSPMSVHDALIEINAALDEYLSQDEADLDAETRFALTFFESFGYGERDFGDAEGLAKARNIPVASVCEAGILQAVAGKARLLRRSELPDDWDPALDKRLCVWESVQHLIKRLESGGEDAAASLLHGLGRVPGHPDLAVTCKALAYRLYNHCEKTKQAEEARAYNGLVTAWPELERLAASVSEPTVQPALL